MARPRQIVLPRKRTLIIIESPHIPSETILAQRHVDRMRKYRQGVALVLVADADGYGGRLAEAGFEAVECGTSGSVFVCCATGAGDGADWAA